MWQENTWKEPKVTREWHSYARKRHYEWVKSERGQNAIKGMLRRQNNKCFYCKCLLVNELGNKLVQYEVDHMKPIWKGGMNKISNYCIACRQCNRQKGANLLYPEVKKRRSKNPEYKHTRMASNKRSLAYKIARRLPTDYFI